jgi:NAD(P)-dependent dehydrogenase (short-subunit alcohol dehydrogenase family)
MSGRLTGKVTIVTGAGSGLGAEAAVRFGAEGGAVLCADVNLNGASETADRIAAAGGQALPLLVDVADPTATEAMAAAALERWGSVDVLYACAGATSPKASATSTSFELWDKVIAVNLTGSWLCARAVLPTMMERERGSIIFVSSGAALLGVNGTAPYAAAKGGIVSLTRQIATEYGAFNVRVNAIAPGSFWTPMNQKTYESRVEQGVYASIEEGIAASTARYPIPRFGTMAENADLALFLASDESTWITGLTIPIDGGLTSSSGLVANVLKRPADQT